jgi:osmotically-inducible protein OsmY
MAAALKEQVERTVMNTLRTVLLSLLIVVVGFVAFTYLSGSTWTPFNRADRPAAIGTSGNVETVKERGAEMGEKVAVAAAKVKEEAGEAALTSKIKAKMVLDDNIKARAIDVSTDGSTVTLTGTVRTVDEHDRAVRLARETAGVTQVADHLRIEVK